MKIQASFNSGQLVRTIQPRVALPCHATLVAVPVKVGDQIAELSDLSGKILAARSPFSSVNYLPRAVFTSGASLPIDENGWLNVMHRVLTEIDAMRTTDGARDESYYIGYVPKRSFGLSGLGHKPGRVSVVFTPGPNNRAVLETVVHEVGHNLDLDHAPCGNPSGVDPNYPYANANLGATGRYIWSYNVEDESFTDPRDVNQHDVMSYCFGGTFSDYNYRKSQKYIRPSSANISQSQQTQAHQEVILVSGTIVNGHVTLFPLKRLKGAMTENISGSHVVRLTTVSGFYEYPFDVKKIDHIPHAFGFALTAKDPGVLSKIEVLQNSRILAQRASNAQLSRKDASIQPVSIRVDENDLIIDWDAGAYPFVSVAHLGANRTTLAFDLPGGHARLPLKGVPAGGLIELSLSDGLNSRLVTMPR